MKERDGERVELELPNVSWSGINCSVKGRIEPIGLQEVKKSLWQWRHCTVFSFHPKLDSGSTRNQINVYSFRCFVSNVVKLGIDIIVRVKPKKK